MDWAIPARKLAIIAMTSIAAVVFMWIVFQFLRIRSRSGVELDRMGGRSGRIGDIGPRDTGNVLQDADKRMAYGYYEDAATLVLDHINKDGKSAPLVMKLLEIYFIWGNRDEFDNAAEQFASTLKAEGEWHKVETMRQAFSKFPSTERTGA